MLLVKREESRDFDVFFGCFVCVFLVFGREQKFKKNVFLSWSEGAWGLYSLGAFFETAALEGKQALKALKKCGSGYL